MRLFLLISLGFFLTFVACGIKGPPVAPRAVVLPSVKDLKAEVEGHKVRLTWSVPTKGDTALEWIEGFKVFRSRALDSEAPCPGCPIPFFEYLDIDLKDPEPGQVEEGRVAYHVMAQPGDQYAYKVVTYDKTGSVSEDSNIVQVTVK